jgi:hypothetical protein
MRRSFIIAWALLLAGLCCVQQSSAFWQSRDSNYNIAISTSSYQGPGDVVSGAQEWWGLRCYNNAYSGNVADITDATTGNTTGTRLQCSNGTVSALVSASACTFVTGNACVSLATTCAVSCNIEELYDQSGALQCSSAACNMVQSTNADRPTLALNCIGSLPCAQGFVGVQINTTANITSISQPYTISLVAYSTSTSNFDGYTGSTTTNEGVQNASASAEISLTASNFADPGVAFATSVWHAVQAIPSGTSGVLNIDNSATTVNSGTDATGSVAWGFLFIYQHNGNNEKMTEVGLWASGFNTTQQTNMCHNQRLYWNTAGSC